MGSHIIFGSCIDAIVLLLLGQGDDINKALSGLSLLVLRERYNLLRWNFGSTPLPMSQASRFDPRSLQ